MARPIKTKPGHIETYVDASGEHRWRFVASNGKILATSSEGYKRERDMESAMLSVFGERLAEIEFKKNKKTTRKP